MKYIVVFIALFASTLVWSQKLTFVFKGVIENSDDGRKESGVNIAVVQNGSSLYTTNSVSSGKYSFGGEIDFSQPFDVVFSKSGLVAKKIHFDLTKMNIEDIPPGDFRPIESLDMTMFKERPGVDFSFLNTEPVGSFDWNTRQMNIRLDIAGRDRVKQKIDELLKEDDQNDVELEQKYSAAIQAADKLFNEKSYEESLAKYEEALTYKPMEKYPADRIMELDALIQAQRKEQLAAQQATEKYDNLIKQADGFLKQSSYRAARDKYEEASKLRPSEQYPKDKLAEIEKKLNEQKEKEELKKKYDDAVAEGDRLFDAEDYEGAKTKYEEALAIESASTYVKGRVAICDEKLAAAKAEKERLEKIAKLLAQGNNEINEKIWDIAKATFEEVLTLESGHPEATERLAFIEQKLKEEADMAAQEKKYVALMKEGDVFEKGQKLQDALGKYQEAKGIKDTPEVNERIAAVEKLIADEKNAAERETQYAAHMSEGESMLGILGDVDGAKKEFEAALAIFPDRQEPKDKIAKIDKLLADQQAAKEKKEQYEAAVKEGDHFFNTANWEEAQKKYREALTFDANQQYPKDKIVEIEKVLSENAAKEEQKANYDAAIAEADQLFASAKWNEAKTKYLVAKGIDGTQAYPDSKITEIEGILANEAANAEKKAQYDAAVKKADELLAASKLDDAKLKYQEALSIDNNQSYPVQKINEIDALIAQNEADKAKKEQYDALVAEADGLFLANDLENARTKYMEAHDLDGTQTYPTQKIEEINKKLADQMAASEKQAKYDAAITEGDAMFASKNYTGAKVKYQEAISIDGGQQYPKDQITALEKLLAEETAALEKQAAYDKAIKDADQLFELKQYSDAKSKYQAAIAIDETQQYPKDKLVELDQLIAENAAEKEKQDKINALLAEGKDLYQKSQLDAAKGKYQSVLGIDAGNVEANEMISKIEQDLLALQNKEEQEKLFAELKSTGFALADEEKFSDAKAKLNQALSIKPDQEIVAKIDEINRIESQLAEKEAAEKRYSELITEAENKEESGDLSGAVFSFKAASNIKPEEIYPKDKIDELEAKIAANKGDEQARIDAEYKAIMDKANALMAAENYLEAIREYNNALSLKPGEKEPVEKAAEAERLEKAKSEADAQYEKILSVAQKKIDESDYVKATELLERAISLKERDERPKKMLEEVKLLQAQDKKYRDLMSEGNTLAASKNYEGAKAKYEEAKRAKPSASEPPVKIAEMEKLINDLASSEQKEALYQEFMSKGQQNADVKNYEQALSHYQSALGAKPNDVPAKDKIAEMQQILDDIANKKAASLDKANQFNSLVKEADGLFGGEEYLGAKVKYEEALKIDPSSTYVQTQIDECIRLERKKSEDEAEREYRKIIAAADKNFDIENWDKAKDYYQRALNNRRDDPYPKQRLNEIEAILNPVLAQSPELEDLGLPYKNSLEEGMKELQRAEEERKALKRNKIAATQKEIRDAEVEMTYAKTDDHYQTSEQIYEYQRQIIRDNGEARLSQDENNEIIRKAESELAKVNSQDARMEYATNQTDQVELERINREVAIDYGERESVYMENADLMEDYNTAMAKEIRQNAVNDYGKNIESDQHLNDVRALVSDNSIDDFEERAAVRGQVELAHDYAVNEHSQRNSDRYETNIENKGRVNDVIRQVEEKSVADAQKPRNNQEDLTVVRNNISDKNYQQDRSEYDHAYEADAGMADVRRRVSADAMDMDGNRVESNEVLKQSKKELFDAQYEEYNSEQEKYVRNKSAINEEVKLNGEVKEREIAMHGEKVAYVNMMDKKATIQTQESIEGDEEERLAAKKKIESVYNGVSKNSVEQVEKHAESNETLKDVTKTIKSQEYANNIGQTEKHYDNQASINKIDNKPKEKPKVANALGEEYPEGVSEESFQQTDQNGLMTAIITRRIVVIDGQADVYVRTQTLNGLTYSKNGKPIVSHVWSKETQDPKLARHY